MAGKSKGKERSRESQNRPERRIVQPHPDGGWQVRKPGAKRASERTDTQEEAVKRAGEILQNLGGGELTIMGRDGKIRDSDTVPFGNDPNPPRDRK